MDKETKRGTVRLIKRHQRDLEAQPLPDSSSAAKEGPTSRDLAATVNSWIEELRQRRRSEAADLFKLWNEGPSMLFGAAADAGRGR